jgi:hypothetical protein
MGPPLTSKSATSQNTTDLYTEQFSAILAEHRVPAPISVLVKTGSTIRGRQKLLSDDARHLPALRAAALGCLLLFSTGTASWYAIVDPIWSTPITIPTPVTTSLHVRPTSPPNSRLIQGGMPLTSAARAVPGADEWVFATVDPILPGTFEVDVEIASLSTPSQTMHRPTPDLIASFVETAPNAPTSGLRLPKDPINVRSGNDPEKPVTIRNGEVKGAVGSPSFVGLYPERPQSSWPNISTASRAGTGTSQSEDPQLDSSSADFSDAKGNARSHAGPRGPHSDSAPSSDSQGKKDSKSDKTSHDSDAPAGAEPKGGGQEGPGGGATAEGKSPKAGKDKPSALGDPQDNHNSNRSGPSPGKADRDKNSKSNADKNKGSGGKDNGRKGRDKGPH